MEAWKKESMRLVNQLETPIPNISSQEMEWDELVIEFRNRGIPIPDFYDFWEKKNSTLTDMRKILGKT